MAISNATVSQLGTNIFDCPSGEYAVTCVVFCNFSVSNVTINVYAVPSGGGVGT